MTINYCVILLVFIDIVFSENAEVTSPVGSFYSQGIATKRKSVDGHWSIVVSFHEQDSSKKAIEHILGCNMAMGMPCVVKKIPYERTDEEAHVLPIHYSACFRCGVCLAVANKLNSLFSDIQDVIEFLPWKNTPEYELNPDVLTLVLNATCHNSFKRYGIRTDFRQERSFSAGHNVRLPTTFDGQWPEKLREACLRSIYYYDGEKLYQDWLQAEDKSGDLTQRLLCRSEGVFRDCSSTPLTTASKIRSSSHMEYTEITCAE